MDNDLIYKNYQKCRIRRPKEDENDKSVNFIEVRAGDKHFGIDYTDKVEVDLVVGGKGFTHRLTPPQAQMFAVEMIRIANWVESKNIAKEKKILAAREQES